MRSCIRHIHPTADYLCYPVDFTKEDTMDYNLVNIIEVNVKKHDTEEKGNVLLDFVRAIFSGELYKEDVCEKFLRDYNFKQEDKENILKGFNEMKTYEEVLLDEGELRGENKKLKEVALNLLKHNIAYDIITKSCGCTKEDLTLWAKEPTIKFGF